MRTRQGLGQWIGKRVFAACLAGVSCLAMLSQAASAQTIPILIDTDIGDAIDDALAVSFALRSPEFDILAITTVIDDVESKARLAQRLLRVHPRALGIPVAMGAPEALLNPARGSGSREYEVLTGADVLADSARESAAGTIVDAVRNARSPVTIVAIGPLTNIALALKTDPSIKNNLERIVLIGGDYTSPEAEYNIRRDPVAAAIVFQSGVGITALGLEVTRPLQLREADLNRLRMASDPAGILTLQLLELAEAETGEAHPILYDVLAFAVLLRPEVAGMREASVSVDLETGQTTFSPADRSRVVVGTEVDAAAVLDLFTARMTAGLR